MNEEIAKISLLDKAKKNIVALTGLLVAVPAFINAGIDIYKVVLKAPRTNEEQVNAELFKANFNKQPLIVVPVPVKTSMGTIDMQLSIYEAGDILAEYGDHLQWFPSPMKEPQQTSGIRWISEAYAGPIARGIGKFLQKDIASDGNKIIRERYFENGVKETLTINTNTGRIDEKKIEEISASAFKSHTSETVKVLDFRTIDLEALKKKDN